MAPKKIDTQKAHQSLFSSPFSRFSGASCTWPHWPSPFPVWASGNPCPFCPCYWFFTKHTKMKKQIICSCVLACVRLLMHAFIVSFTSMAD